MDEDLREGAEVDAARTNRASLPDVYALVRHSLRTDDCAAHVRHSQLYSLGPDSAVGRLRLPRALLAGIAERGADAVGYAHRETGGRATVTQLRGGAGALLDEIAVPPSAVGAHPRALENFTKGHPDVEANNHPIRHRWCRCAQRRALERRRPACRYGIERHDLPRAVDSEAIFALMELRPERRRRVVRDPGARWRLAGSTGASPTPSSSRAASPVRWRGSGARGQRSSSPRPGARS